MTYQVDEREARKAYVRRRQTIVFSISGAVLPGLLSQKGKATSC